MALWPVAISALNIAEDVEDARTDICETRTKFKNNLAKHCSCKFMDDMTKNVRFLLQ